MSSIYYLGSRFLRELVTNPGDYKGAISCILDANNSSVSQAVLSNFVMKYSRATIMDKMSNELINIMEHNK